MLHRVAVNGVELEYELRGGLARFFTRHPLPGGSCREGCLLGRCR